MDEMLSISLWIMIMFVSSSAFFGWFASQPGTSEFGLDLNGYSADTSLAGVSGFQNIACTMTSLVDLPGYAFCFIGKITSPILGYDSGGTHYQGIVEMIWNLLTNWTNIINLIFGDIPGGDLAVSILIPFFSLVELGAATLLLMRLAVIIRGSGAIGI